LTDENAALKEQVAGLNISCRILTNELDDYTIKYAVSEGNTV